MAEEKALDKKQWGAIYNRNLCEQVIQAVSRDEVFCWNIFREKSGLPFLRIGADIQNI